MGRVGELGATISWAVRERSVGTTIRSTLKAPLVLRAAADVAALRTIDLPDLVAELGADSLTVPAGAAGRHAWQLGPVERALLGLVVERIGATSVFEIGTFDGTTTLALAELVPPGGVVHTIDLPDDAFDQTQDPDTFRGADVGLAFRDVDAATDAKIDQLRGDSLTFDFTPWHGTIDLVLVDGAHDRAHGMADSRTALQLVAPGGWIFWDDFEPYWHGLVEGIIEVVGSDRLTKVARSSLAYVRG